MVVEPGGVVVEPGGVVVEPGGVVVEPGGVVPTGGVCGSGSVVSQPTNKGVDISIRAASTYCHPFITNCFFIR